MHGRPRPPKGSAIDAALAAKAAQKAQLYAALAGEVLTRRTARRYDTESLALAAKLLELNPEVCISDHSAPVFFRTLHFLRARLLPVSFVLLAVFQLRPSLS
jgi:hypothetical protein